CAAAAAEVPGAAEIIFRSSAIDAGFFVVIDENHFIALTHPAVFVLQNSESDAHQVAASASLSEDIILLPVGIQFLLAAGILDRRIRRCLAILGVEVQAAFRKTRNQLVVDIR